MGRTGGGQRAPRLRWKGPVLWLGLCMGLVAAASAHADADALKWIPADTRVVFQIDPRRASQQPKAREMLGLDPLLAKVSRLPGEGITARLVAYVSEGATARPVVITQGSQSLAKAVEKMRGAKLETAGGVPVYASATAKDWVVALVAPNALIEGPRQTVRAVLEHAANDGKSLSDVPAEESSRRLLGVPGAGPAPVSLVYLAPGDGMDLYAILEDLDRILGAEMSTALAAYKSPIKMLGTTRGLRLDLQESPQELDTTLRLAMPNPMAARIASVSLLAGKDMAKVASDAAVKAGNMTAEDAGVLASALETLESQADGDQVRVRLRVADGVAQRH